MNARNILFTALTLPLLLTGCQSVNNSIDAIGGLFSRDNDEEPSLLDNSETGQEWHCYGKENQPDWDCTELADPARIAAVSAVTIAPSVTAPVATAETVAAPDESTASLVTPDVGEVVMAPAPEMDNQPQIVGMGATILQQPADGYAVQLLALQDEERLLAFASKQGLATPLHTRILSAGEPWYVLLLGLYPDRASAETAKRNWIVGKNLELDPWVRNLGPLQSDIQRGLQAQLGER